MTFSSVMFYCIKNIPVFLIQKKKNPLKLPFPGQNLSHKTHILKRISKVYLKFVPKYPLLPWIYIKHTHTHTGFKNRILKASFLMALNYLKFPVILYL